ncbi:sigma-E factor negative regulatory protein [Variovorax sp. RHLX14]|uniref:sigma-E factor negative regulatory protein n=1 Tax=Variovorax sp. RHLX14 TaxID=1259731 RepID=UPI003F460711
MNETKQSVREQISALADGSLQGEDFSRISGAIAADQALQSTWRTYHVIGDVLRSGEHAPCSDSAKFMARFQQRMAAEVPVAPVAPGAPAAVVPQQTAARPVRMVAVEAANEPVFRWKLVAGAASLAAAAAIGWNLVGVGAAPAGMQMAQQQQQQLQVQQQQPVQVASRLDATPVLVGSNEAQVMLRDPRLDVLLEAHRQAGGASQMPSGFLRNATFDGPSR